MENFGVALRRSSVLFPPLLPPGSPFPRRHRLGVCPEAPLSRPGPLFQPTQPIVGGGLPSVPPRHSVSHHLRVDRLAVGVQHKKGTPIRIVRLGHGADSLLVQRPPQGPCCPVAVGLPELWGIHAVKLHPHDLPGLAEKVNGVAVQDVVDRSRK